MIDKSGKAAVMDFGIARSIEAGETMTQTGMLDGYARLHVARASDGRESRCALGSFHFGVILYEILVGPMPYKADSAQAAMFKRTREKAKPPIEVNPENSAHPERHRREVPGNRSEAALSDRRAKYCRISKPGAAALSRAQARSRSAPAWTSRFRWKTVGAGVGGPRASGGRNVRLRARLLSSKPAPSAAPAVSLAIIPFHNASGDQSLDWLGSSVAEVLSTDVGQSSHLRIVSSERVSQIFSDLQISPDTALDPPTIQRLADFSKADNVVWGQYARLGDQIRIDATVQNIKSGHSAKVTESASGKNIFRRR